MSAAHKYTEETLQREAPATRGAPLELRPGVLYRRFADEMEVRPEVFWLDLLTSTSIGWIAFAIAAAAAPWSFAKIAGSLVSTFALYRAVLFIHELAHLRPGAVKGFETVWNLVAGLPLLVPSLMYVGPHNDHHRKKIFGTGLDPEYEPIALWSPAKIMASGFSMFFVPAVLILRWGIIGPIAWLIPPMRRFLIERASTLLINARYQRRQPNEDERARWIFGEVGAAVVAWMLMAGLYTGVIGTGVFIQYYAIASAILMVNYARTLAAHRYDNEEAEMDDIGQLLDSVNLMGGSWLTLLSAPVGLRYHALHHFMPALPYHSLGRVHRALLEELPEGSPYRQTTAPGMWTTLRELFATASGAGIDSERHDA